MSVLHTLSIWSLVNCTDPQYIIDLTGHLSGLPIVDIHRPNDG